MSALATRLNYINPTREEIGDIDAILAKAAAADARRKALLSKFWLKGKPVEKPVEKAPEPAPLIVPPEVAPQPKPEIIAYCNGEPITRDYIFVSTNPLAVTTADCIKYICLTEGIPKSEIIGRRRTNRVAFARQRIAYLARTYTTLSFPEIGRRLGGKDHTTILHAYRKVQEAIRQGKYRPPTADEIVRLVRPAAFKGEAVE